MQRIGRDPIPVPKAVTLTVKDREVAVKGPKGNLTWTVPKCIDVALEQDGQLLLRRRAEDKHSKSCHGTAHRLLTNMIIGVTEGFKRELELQGIGYRAMMEGQRLKLELAFSHPIYVDPPAGIAIETPKQTSIIVSGIDKQQVGQVAANIRRYRRPEPYKGKGIRYIDEYVRRKEGKTGIK
jgi:large subunit ribosomal protein L6